jgi:hypothetical protein
MRRSIHSTTARLGVLALMIAGLAVSGPPAHGDTLAPLQAKMKQRFTTAQPGAWTGWTFDGAMKPLPAGEQIPPQRSTTLVYPRGTRFDLSRVANCTASDEEIVTGGLGVCPKSSRVGTGEASLSLGALGALDLDAHLFVARPGFALAFATESGAVLRVLRPAITRNRVSFAIPSLPLPGGGEAAFTRVSLKVKRAGTREHPVIRTPAKCPRSGRWTFTYLPVYDEPHGVQRSTSSVRCARD